MNLQSHIFMLSRNRFFSVWMLQKMLNNSAQISWMRSLMKNGTGLWKTMRNLLLTRFSLQKRKRKWWCLLMKISIKWWICRSRELMSSSMVSLRWRVLISSIRHPIGLFHIMSLILPCIPCWKFWRVMILSWELWNFHILSVMGINTVSVFVWLHLWKVLCLHSYLL